MIGVVRTEVGGHDLDRAVSGGHGGDRRAVAIGEGGVPAPRRTQPGDDPAEVLGLRDGGVPLSGKAGCLPAKPPTTVPTTAAAATSDATSRHTPPALQRAAGPRRARR
ncbi:MAG: hypothetical protein ABS81_06755 [Pseudonocardia sp. SCN 72-86]|nr:MAG: hypothetical protein ABS81_06755 [Pseudonocardia sp. SCN 72-86]